MKNTSAAEEKSGNKKKITIICALAVAVIAGVILIIALSGNNVGKILPGIWVCSEQNMTLTVNEDMTCVISFGDEKTLEGKIEYGKEKISGIYPVYTDFKPNSSEYNNTYFLTKDNDGNWWLFDHEEYETGTDYSSFKKVYDKPI
jgi:hypothetical protein